jgi:hypothetical protein
MYIRKNHRTGLFLNFDFYQPVMEGLRLGLLVEITHFNLVFNLKIRYSVKLLLNK